MHPASDIGGAALALSLLAGSAWASSYCTPPQDMTVLEAAALQQRLMVAAFTCHDVAAYNSFVLAHQAELQESDKGLMDFFARQDAQTGFDKYNLYKTELANASSLRAVRDPSFCRAANANFNIVLDPSKPLAELLLRLPYPVDTGYLSCTPYVAAATPVTTTPYATAANPVSYPPATRRVRHRTWLGRLVDAIKSIF